MTATDAPFTATRIQEVWLYEGHHPLSVVYAFLMRLDDIQPIQVPPTMVIDKGKTHQPQLLQRGLSSDLLTASSSTTALLRRCCCCLRFYFCHMLIRIHVMWAGMLAGLVLGNMNY